ncbi:MAG: nucleoside deaminase [Chlamydiales bacterium]|nr:nucleoside deaminase [Chlamydiales bacterium]
MSHPNPKFMKRAIELSAQAGLVEKSGGVFGAVIVKGDKIIAEGYNRVIKEADATCHAEIDVIRKAGKALGSPHLDGCILYTSAYCCPMCLCGAYWAQIKEIYYGATVEDSKKYGDFLDVDYYKEMCLPDKDKRVKIREFMREEAVEVWKKFSQMPDRAHY